MREIPEMQLPLAFGDSGPQVGHSIGCTVVAGMWCCVKRALVEVSLEL